ncbi:MAG TPA: hypothetical protein VFP40_01905 [Terriglobales bacterium]|nr:hypothetical protein [Terriglobales bacterium]
MYEPLPEEEPVRGKETFSPKFRFQAALLVVALAVCGAGAYSVHEHSVAKDATDQNAQMMASLKSTNAQIEQLTAKLNELTAPKPAPQAQPDAEAGYSYAKPSARPTAARHTVRHRAKIRRDDPRWKKMQEQLDAQNKAIDAQGKAIDSTRSDLTNALNGAKTELGDSIARTHGELVALQRKGEKNYFEFDIYKGKQFVNKGSVGIKLRKANDKHQYADLELMVDDRSLTKKHVNIYEPTTFYSADSEMPIQIVINGISKDHIRGYVVEPKYRRNELTAMQQQNAAPSADGQPQQPRQRLSLPR